MSYVVPDDPTAPRVPSAADDGGAPELVLYDSHPAMFRNHPFGFILSLLLIAAFGAGLLILFVWWLRCLGERLTITSERTTFRRGLLARHTSDVYHADVRNVQVDQTLFQRIFGVGTLSLSSAGQADVEIVAAGLPHPEQVKNLIIRCRREQRPASPAADGLPRPAPGSLARGSVRTTDD